MKTLEDLTPEIRAKIDIYKEKCVKDLYSGVEYENFDRAKAVRYIEKIYEITKRDKPVIIVANDPIDYSDKFNLLQDNRVLNIIYKIYLKKNNKSKSSDEQPTEKEIKASSTEIKKTATKSHYLYLCSTYHRVYLMWYKFIQDEFGIDHKNKEILDWLYENANNGISRCYFTPMYVLVLRMPKYIRRNNIGFHSIDSPAIEWENYGIHYINGRKLATEKFNAVVNNTYAFNDFINETNENDRASITTLISEKFGHQKLMEFLNAQLADEKTIDHSSGYSEIVRIWKTKKTYSFLSDINGNTNQPYAWLELKCPSSGSIFLIPTSPHFTDAIEACKFHRPQEIPMELKYDFKSFNN